MIRKGSFNSKPAYHNGFMAMQIQAVSSGYRSKFAGLEAATQALNPGELLKMSGPAIFLDRISSNGRKYIPESVHAQVAALQPRIAAKALFGELDHPPVNDLMRLAYVDMKNVSHRIDRMWFNEAENCYYIDVTILDTPNGRILKAIHDAGSPLYVSLRSLLNPEKAVSHGAYEDSYIAALITIDFVSQPGFADAELKPMAVGNESMLAVCESLDILKQLQNNYKLSKHSSMKRKSMYAIESVISRQVNPTDDFQAQVNGVILMIAEDFPDGFSYDEFNSKYSGVVNDSVVKLYPGTAELQVDDKNGKISAVVQLTKCDSDCFEISKDSEVTYGLIDDAVANMPEVAEPVDQSAVAEGTESRKHRMYAIVGTENYTPGNDVVTEVTSIFNRLLAEFPHGFSKSEFNDVLNVIKNGSEFNAEISDDCITVKCPANQNAAKISLNVDGDTYSIGEIMEYFNPEEEEEPGQSPAVEAIIAAAKFRWNNGGKEKYAALEAEYLKSGNLAGADNVQPGNVDTDNPDESNDSNAIRQNMYQVIEDGSPESDYVLVDDDGNPIAEQEDKNDLKGEGEKPESDGTNEFDETHDEIATEAARILGMSRSKYDSIYAIKNMPVAYKHIWKGLSKSAREVIAEQAKYVATEAECLKFWQNTDFIAIESAVLRAKGTEVLTAGLEAKTLDTKKSILGTLPSVSNNKIW